MSKAEWNKLYEFNAGVDECDFSENKWQTIPIPTGTSAETVYKLLPPAEQFEYGGHLTESHVHYVECRATSASTTSSNLCTFHSHPTNLKGAEPDLPSGKDIYSFLKWRHQRAVTVGKKLIWVFDKTLETVPVIKKLAAWEKGDMIRVMKELTDQHVEDLSTCYCTVVLNALGLDWPKRSR